MIQRIFFKCSSLYIRYHMMKENRFCDRCMQKTLHEIFENEDTIYTYKRKRIYKCDKCGYSSYKRGLRPSAESVY
jgi:uncharacterized Zn finger protein